MSVNPPRQWMDELRLRQPEPSPYTAPSGHVSTCLVERYGNPQPRPTYRRPTDDEAAGMVAYYRQLIRNGIHEARRPYCQNEFSQQAMREIIAENWQQMRRYQAILRRRVNNRKFRLLIERLRVARACLVTIPNMRGHITRDERCQIRQQILCATETFRSLWGARHG
jgi:hypothetical protein